MRTNMSLQRNFIRSSCSLGAAVAIFLGGYSTNSYAVPAVFFNDDTAAGKSTLISTITSASSSAVIVDFNVANTSTNGSGVTAISTPSAGTVYIKTTRGGSVAQNSSNYQTDGFTQWAVPAGTSWSALVNAGYKLEFFSDASLTTPFLMNAIGLRVADWGTCCTGSNRLPDGTTAAGSALYIQFGSSPEMLIGSISSSRSGRETFIGAIDDRNSFSSVTLIPNGSGEAFLAGGEFVFSQVPVPVGSVPAGSSSVVGASNPGASSPPPASIPDIDTAVGAYTTTQLAASSVNPNFTGGTLTVAAAGTYTNNFTVQTQGGTVNNDGLNATFSGVYSGVGPMAFAGAGVTTLAGVNTYTGGTTVNSGSTLALSGSGSIAASSLITNNGTLNISGTTSGASITSLAGSGTTTLGARTLTITNGSSTFSGTIGGTGGLTVSGGTQTLSGANTYTGDTIINSGSTLALSGSGSIANSGVIFGVGALDISGTTSGATIKNLLGSGTVALGSKDLTIADGDSSAYYVYSGVVSGTGGLVVSGGSFQKFEGVSTYTGATTIGSNSGLSLRDSGSIASSSLVTNNGLLEIDETTSGASITSLAGSGTTMLGAQTLTITNASSTFSGVIGGTGGLVIAGGTQTLSGANTYSGGTTVSGGTLQGTTTSLQGAITNNATTRFDQSTNGTYAGVMSGTGTLVKSGTGVVTLSGANTYSGGTTVSGGTLQGTTTSLQGAITNNATTQFDQSTNGRYSGNMTGTGSLIKSGTGTATLAGTVNIGGSTSIVGGTLDVVGTVTTSSLQCAGTSATSLSGTGRVNGAVGMGSGCTLAPGSSPGTLTIGGNLTMASGSTFAVEIDGRTYSAAGGAGSYDRVIMATAGTTFTAGGTLSPVLRGLSGAANNNFAAVIGDRFTVVTGDNAGSFSNVNQPVAGMPTNSRFDVLYLPSAIDLILTPNSFAVLGQSDGWTKNAISAAAGYDATRPAAGARTGDSLSLFNLLYQTERSKLGAAFHQLSGQIFADAIQSARFTIENAQDSILGASINDFAETESGEIAVWADVIGRKAEGDSDGTALGYDDEMKGVAAGVALGLGDGSHIGIGTSYGSSKLQGALGSRADVDVKTFYVFGGDKLSERWSYSVAGGVSQYDVATMRELTLANVTTRAKGLGKGGSSQIGAYLKYSRPAFGDSLVSLMSGVESYWVRTRTITEKFAAADGGLTAASESWQETQGILNAEWVIGGGRIKGVLFGELQYDFDKNAVPDRRKIMNNYGASWIVAAPSVDRTQTTFGVGVHADLGDSSGLRFELTNSNRGDGFSDKGGFLRLFFNR
jgi:fibronectin-binding autotransporter adhesin